MVKGRKEESDDIPLVEGDSDRLEPVSEIIPILDSVSQMLKQVALTKNDKGLVCQMVVHVVLGSWNVAEQRFWIGFLIWIGIMGGCRGNSQLV